MHIYRKNINGRDIYIMYLVNASGNNQQLKVMADSSLILCRGDQEYFIEEVVLPYWSSWFLLVTSIQESMLALKPLFWAFLLPAKAFPLEFI